MIRLLFAATLCFALAACGDDDDTNGDGDGAGGLSAAGGETSAAGGETSVVGGEMSAPGGEMSGGGGETRAGGEMGAGGMAGTGGMAGAGGTGGSGDFPELWLHFALSYRNEADCASKRALLDRAVAAGYTGLFVHSFWDALVLTDEIDPHDASYCFDEMMQRISDSGLEVMLSYGTGLGVGEPMLRENPNWAEGFPVRGTPYTVSAAGDRLEPTSENLIPNGGIEEHTGDQVNGWSWNDPTTGVDTEVFHSGGASFRVRLDGENAARGGIAMTLTPYRQYEVRFWAKTRDVAFLPGDDFWSSFWGVRVRGSGEGGAGWLHYNQFVAESTQDWTEFSFVFHSLGFEAATVYVGAMPWEGQGGYDSFWPSLSPNRAMARRFVAQTVVWGRMTCVGI